MWWEILELYSDAELKDIKKAYARKLKQTRPDDDPEGFKALHTAYKQALDWHANKALYDYDDDDYEALEDQTTQPAMPAVELKESPAQPEPAFAELFLSFSARQTTEDPAPVFQVATLAEPEPIVEPETLQLQTAVLKAPEIAEYTKPEPLKSSTLANPLASETTNLSDLADSDVNEDQFEEDWRSFQQQFSINIHTEQARKDPKAWHFLEQLPSFMDLEFREQLSYELFGFISESNLKSAEHKTLFIKQPVLQYLNQLFAWDQQWHYFAEHFGEQQTDAILLHVETSNIATKPAKRVQPEELHYYSRFMAFVIDIAIILGIGTFPEAAIELPFKVDTGINTYALLIGLWLLAYPLLESSSWEGSIGKHIMGLKVVNKQGQRLNIVHSYLRTLVTTVCILGFKIVVWINMLLAYKRTMLLQDWITQSYVVKRA
ncbi:MAG: RDD family protein [Thiolinea sp.]